MLETIIKGALVSGGLIVAIGSQNVFVLKQGLLKNNIFYVCLLCFVCDFILMSIGALGLGSWINKSQTLTTTLALGGAVFLIYYGFTAFKNSQTLTTTLALGGAVFLIYYGFTAFKNSYKGNNSLDVSNYAKDSSKLGLKKLLLTTLAITLLNPHVYLDTVVIIGGITGTFNNEDKILFLIGGLFVSFIWFFSLGYSARVLAPLFKKQSAWRVFDFVIGCIMFFIAISLIKYAYNQINY